MPALSQQATGALVGRLLHADPASEVTRHVIDLAGGNPLFAEQYARLLLDGDLLVAGPGGPHLVPGAELPVPETVQALLAARLDTLPPEQKALLCDASVIGEAFWEGGVAALSGRDRDEVAAMMAALIDRDLVRLVRHSAMEGETEYLFWHALTRDVAYGRLPRRVRAGKHEAIAAWIEQTTGKGSTEFAEILAQHYATALELARVTGDEEHAASLVAPALRSLTLAGEQSLRLDAVTAERHFARALELAASGSLERLHLLPRLAEALFLTRRLRQACALLEEAVAGLEEAGDRRGAAVAMCMLAHTLPRLGESDRGLTRSAMELLSGEEPSREKAEVLSMHALSVAIENEDAGEALAAAAGAIDLCSDLGQPEPAVALQCRAEARLSLGDPGGLEDHDRAVAAARAQGLGRERATIELNRASSLLALQGPRAAWSATARALQFAREHGLDTYVMNARAQLVACSRDAGDWDRALEEAAGVLSVIEPSEDVVVALCVRSYQVYILAERGDAAAVAPVLPWLVETARDGVGYLRGAALIGAALVSVRLGRFDTGLSLLAQCLESPADVVSNHEIVPSAVRAALWCGDRDLGDALLASITPVSPYPRLPLVRHVVRSVEALLAEAEGDHAAAAAEFSAAAMDWRAFQMAYEEAHARLGLGRCLVELGSAAEAAQVLRQARALFARVRARPALEEADALLRLLPGRSEG